MFEHNLQEGHLSWLLRCRNNRASLEENHNFVCIFCLPDHPKQWRRGTYVLEVVVGAMTGDCER